MDNIRTALSTALQWESAHLSFHNATSDLKFTDVGKTADNIPYTIWELVEHIRIAQKDIVHFCLGEGYEATNWPDDYWPDNTSPESQGEWQNSLQQVREDRDRMVELVEEESNDLFKPFDHGKGQHLFREAILLIDHESYHTGQIVTIRKILGIWK